jgi:branched-chain amino acid transport system substrate-binding protein
MAMDKASEARGATIKQNQGRTVVSVLKILMAGIVAAHAATAVNAADSLKIGVIGTLSGPGGSNGIQSLDGMKLALGKLAGKVGGLPTTLVVEDDQLKPDVARQLVDKLQKSDRVDLIVTAGFSNILLAIAPVVTKSEMVLISTIAGPSGIAGKGCSEYFFSTSWQGDNYSEALGSYLQKAGKKDIYLMAPNYAAGRDVLTGFKRFYTNSVAGEVYTPLSQLDFSAELAQIRAANPAAVFVFYPGGLGVQFFKQYSQSGLRDKIPLYTAYTVDNNTLVGIGDDAIGSITATFWGTDLDNSTNKQFVSAYQAAQGLLPAETSAQGYDVINLLDSAIRSVQGKVEDKRSFLAALKKADFKSVRGDFRYNTNHFPIQDFYLAQVVKGDDGKPRLKLGERIFKDHHDAYAAECSLK